MPTRKRRKRRFSGQAVNASVPIPDPPGDWLDDERCHGCGSLYRDHRAGLSFAEAAQLVRLANGAQFDEREGRFIGGGGFRSRGPVLHYMRANKLLDFYLEHSGCCPDEPEPTLRSDGVLVDAWGRELF